jgi:hypothetical protein
MVAQIEQMLKDAWKNFCDYYDENAPQYRDSCGFEPNGQQAKDAHWICWDEYDLTFHIGRFFYEILSGKKEKEFSKIEVHFEKKVDRSNFSGKGYEFENQLENLKNQLGMKKGPKVDMIVAQEDSGASFLLCAEVKCFRGTRYENPIPMIYADIEKLRAYRDFGIAKEVIFILFDNYYYCHDEDTANEIKQKLDEIEKDGIKVLFHTSEAKLRVI